MSKKKEMMELSARERRRQRRIRNQIWAYVTVCVLLIGVGTGVFFGIRTITEKLESKRHEEAMAAQMAAMDAEAEKQEAEESEEPEEIEEYTQEDLLDEMVDAGIAEMSLEDRVAGIFLTTPEELTGVGKAVQAGKGTEEALSKYAVGGLVYAALNVQSEEQFSGMLTDTLPKSKYPLFLIFDDKTDVLTEDLSVYGINMEFSEKGEEKEAETFWTVSLPSLTQEEDSSEMLATAQMKGDADSIVEKCRTALEDGADLLYVPENFAEAYEELLAEAESDEELQDRILEALEKIYRVKYRGRLQE